MKELIVQIINNSTGIKAVELTLALMEKTGPTKFDLNNYNICIHELLKEEAIVELEYWLPSMRERTKSIYFPKGTEFAI